jgi:hypothetical protein
MYSLIHQGYAASGGEFDPEEIQRGIHTSMAEGSRFAHA